MKSPSQPSLAFWQKLQRTLGSARILVVSFAGAILLATFLLMLPQAAQKKPVGFIDALFIITSATGVTGLSIGKDSDMLVVMGHDKEVEEPGKLQLGLICHG